MLKKENKKLLVINRGNIGILNPTDLIAEEEM